MGQALNVEIQNRGEVIANAYYHWGGYTSSAIERIEIILENLDSISEENEFLRAIRLLEQTGARLKEKEIVLAKEIISHKEEFEVATTRNQGLIAISPEAIQEIRNSEESRAIIHLDKKIIDFDAYLDFDRKTYIERYSEKEYRNLPVLEFDYPFDAIPFVQFKNFSKLITEFKKNSIFELKIGKGSEVDVFTLIE